MTTTPATTATTEPPSLRTWLPWLLVPAAIWGCSFVFIEVGIRELHPLYVTLGRVACGAVALLAILAIRRESLPRSPLTWAHLAAIGFFGAAVPFTLFGYGEERIPSLLAGIWNGTTPLVVLPVAVLVFRTERFTRNQALGLALGFAGTLIILGAWRGTDGADLLGQLMCFGAAVCYGVAIPYQARFLTPRMTSDLAIAATMLVCATVEVALIAPFVAGAPPAITSLSPEVIASVVALGALGTGAALALHMRNVRRIGGSNASYVTYLVPIFAIALGVLVLDEKLEWYQPVGAAVVLYGVALSQGRFRRRPR
ncbi:DMT family transporter [Nocardioides speluncae]|uniref:DMT family transporter n=1 Tax=Nocardioides speluncae TaxID=2670337 RepID=UPI001F0CB980|nr:DMT family transporter [Nocardioides speluncae]